MTDLESFYQEKIGFYNQRISEISKKTTFISWARVLVAFVTLLLVYFLFKDPALFWLVLLGVLGYAYLVTRHEKLKYQFNWLIFYQVKMKIRCCISGCC